ncbi:MAG: hypothetical protein KDA99_19950 [Planctomycetales bacterium]|nr:hypothetical protein [Planctomycetales bacterium]
MTSEIPKDAFGSGTILNLTLSIPMLLNGLSIRNVSNGSSATIPKKPSPFKCSGKTILSVPTMMLSDLRPPSEKRQSAANAVAGRSK